MENIKRNAQMKEKRRKDKESLRLEDTVSKSRGIDASITEPISLHQLSHLQPQNELVRRSISLKVTNLDTSHTENIASNYKSEEIHSIKSQSQSFEDDTLSRFIGFCEKGDSDKVREYLEGGAVHVNVKLQDQRNCLHVVINSPKMSLRVIVLLLEYGINADQQNAMGRTPLILSTIKSNISVCKILIEHKCQIDLQDMYGNTALHYACIHGWYNIAKILLTYGASAEIKNKSGEKAQECCLNGQIYKLFSFKSEYNNRTVIEEAVIQNSRNDHVQRLISQAQQDSLSLDIQPPSPTQQSPKKENKWKIKQLHFQSILKQESEFDSIIQMPTSKTSLLEFQYIDLLGKGTFGQVYLVEHKTTKELYAMKLLSKAQIKQNRLLPYVQMEKKILSMVKHPFIVGLHYAFQTVDKLILVMTYCPGGDMLELTKKIKRMDEERIRRYTAEIVLGLECLHKAEIIYRDLKPANVVLDKNGHACITDFGLAKQSEIAHSFCGSLAYLAPEMISRRGHTRTIDWYLLGVLIYQCYTGKPPFWDTTKDKLILNIKSGIYTPFEASQEMKDFVAKLLRADPSRRLGGKNDAEDVKQHPWFKGIDWDQVVKMKLEVPPIQAGKVDLTTAVRKQIFTEQDIENSLKYDRIQGWEYSIQ